MRLKTPLVALSSVGLLALAACGGSGSGSDATGGTPSNFNPGPPATARTRPPRARSPSSGAQKGGTVTVNTQPGLTTTFDPSEIYYTDTSSMMSGLIARSLTQYKYDPKHQEHGPGPRPGHQPRHHNDNYTKWTFTIRPGVKWENGKPVTAQEVAFGMTRCMDAATFPTGPCQYYANAYYKGGTAYKGMYTDPGSKFKGIKVNGNTITINDGQALPGHALLGHLPGQRPDPRGQGLGPEDLQEPPPVDRSVHDQEVQPVQGAGARSRTRTGTPRPTRLAPSTPTATTSRRSSQSEKTDQILLADSGSGQTTLTYDDLLAPDFNKMKQNSPGPSRRSAVSRAPTTGRRTTARSPARRCARRCSSPTRTRTRSSRRV